MVEDPHQIIYGGSELGRNERNRKSGDSITYRGCPKFGKRLEEFVEIEWR